MVQPMPPAPSAEPTLARLRRDRWLLWLWVPGGLLVQALAQPAWRWWAGQPPAALTQTLSVLWIVSMFLLIWRHSARRCPDCGYRYLRGFPWISLKRVRCPCGFELK